MFSYVWPMALIILAEVAYQICTKSTPEAMSPFAALTVTYLVAAVTSAVLFFTLERDTGLLREYGKLNWAPVILGVAIVGLEAGWIYAFKAGWQVSTGFVVQSAFLAVALLAVGYLLYQEALTWNKIVGILICLVGLVFLNRR